MDRKTKQKIVLFLGMAVLLTALFASSLSQVVFRPGLPLPAFDAGHLILYETPGSPAVNFQIGNFLLALLGIVVVIYLLVMLYRLLLGTTWKLVLSGLFKSVLVTTAIFLLLAMVILVLPTSIPDMDELPQPPPTQPFVTAPLGPPPVSLLWLVGIVLAVLAAFLLLSLLPSRRKPDQAAQLALEVEKAQQNLLAGLSLKEVILRCYQQMSQILQQEAGIERQAFMTPAEFERVLSIEGYPPAPVHQLTRLFEIARYGDWTPNPWDDQQALESLQAIIAYLREKKVVTGDE